MEQKFDFSGWATRNDILCADGRTIRDGAFKENDGQIVPMVWQHQHNDPFNVLGHMLLEYRPGEGMYGYGKFNDTEQGLNAKTLVQHGDVRSLSIYANQLKQNRGDVLHGTIREVSLVLAGANSGAIIDMPVLEHGDDEETEATIYMDVALDPNPVTLSHAEEEPKEKENEPMAEENKEVQDNRTVKDVYDAMTDEQKTVVQFMIGAALEEAGVGDEDEETEEEEEVKHNVFDNDTKQNSLSHSDYQAIFSDAKRIGSLKEAVQQHIENGVLAHTVTDEDNNVVDYGMANIHYLYPDYKNVTETPEFIKRDNNWVTAVMDGAHKTPFSRIKSLFANITMDEARAKGYIKGKRKKEEVFTLLKRTTDPQTIYKKQKLDRDDIVDITDFNVVAWIKSEMRLMLDEEIARAVLVGDGRLTSDDDHISHDHVRPIWTDDDLYTIKKEYEDQGDDDKNAKLFIRTAIKARKDYKGSGNTVLFTTEENLDNMLLIEDGFGHAVYADEAALARKLRVGRIVTVPVMENLTREDNTLVGIIVDMRDYNIGADKGGAIELFDDFDIDYNQYKSLIETRCSGALIKPYSAIVIEMAPAADGEEEEEQQDDGQT